MTTDRRDHEASSLRLLFREQLSRLTQLFQQDSAAKQQRAEQERDLKGAIEEVVKGTDERVRIAGNYTQQLREGVRQLLDYLNQLVADIPPTIALRKEDFNTNPYLHSFFVNSDEMLRFISFNTEVRQFLDVYSSLEAPEVFALLCVTKTEKKGFGYDLSGDVMVRDVPQTRINFENHNVHFVCDNNECLRSSLKQCLFDSYVNMVNRKMRDQRDTVLTQPDAYLAKLSDLLCHPQQRLTIERNTLRISRMGLLLPEDSKEASSEIAINEVELDNEPFRVIMPIRIQRSELLSPDDYLSEASRLLQ